MSLLYDVNLQIEEAMEYASVQGHLAAWFLLMLIRIPVLAAYEVMRKVKSN